MKVTVPERCSINPEFKSLDLATRSRSGSLRSVIVCSAAILGLFACAQSSSSSQPTNNLTAAGLTIDSAQPRIGFPLQVTIEILALEVTEDVSVALFALNGEDIDNELEEVRQLYLGTVTFPQVDPTTPDYQGEIVTPSELSPPGDYMIMCSIDSGDLIPELDEDDNEAEVAATFAPLQDPNIYILDMVLDSSSIFLDSDQNDVENNPDDVQNSDAGGTLVLGLEGTLDPVDVEAYVKLRLTRSDLPPGSNVHDVPVYLWDSVNNRYVDTYGLFGPVEWLQIGTLSPQDVTEGSDDLTIITTDVKTAHLDVYLPGGLAAIFIEKILGPLVGSPPVIPPPDLNAQAISDLWDFLQGAEPADLSYEALAQVRAVDQQINEVDFTDNLASRPIMFFLPGEESQSPDRPLAFEAGESGNWANGDFGVGFDFDAFAWVDGRGALALVQGSIPTTIFGLHFDFMGFDARAQVVPAIDPLAVQLGETSGFSLQLDFAGTTVRSYEEDLGYSFEGTFSVTKEKSKTKTIFVGPVPVTATGSIAGEIGYLLGSELETGSLTHWAGPFSTLEAELRASVGVPGFQAGAGATVVLLDERFVSSVEAELLVTDPGPSPATFEGTVTMDVTNKVTGPNGRLYLYAEYPGVKWCRRCAFGHCVSYPCGFRTIHREFGLVSWESFVKEDILFEELLCKGVVTDGTNVSFALCD